MRISIILVNWNGRKWLDQCFPSIINQEISEDFEVIFVDNGSLDDSVMYVRENFPQVKVIALDRNYGFAEGNNIGLAKAKGEYLAFINTDTRVEPSWLRNLVDAADQNPAYKILCGVQLPAMNAAIPAIGHFFGVRYSSYPKTSEDVVESNFASGACFLIRRSWLDEVSYLFDPSYFCFSEDTDLSLRTLLVGGKIGYVKKSRLWHFVGGSRYNDLWSRRIDMINSLRNIQKLFSKENYRRILLVRGLFAVFTFLRSPIEIRCNVGRLTGFIEFLMNRKSLLRRDRTFSATATIDERELLQKIRYEGNIGKFIKRFVFKV